MVALVDTPQLKAPALRLHCRGSYFVRLPDGGSHWFGKDKASAERQYALWAADFVAEPIPHKRENSKARLSERSRKLMESLPTQTTSVSVQAVADQLTTLVDAESGEHGKRKVRASLRRFLEKYGNRPIDSLRATDLIAFKASLADLKPNSVNDVLTYTRRLLTFAYEAEFVQAPFRMKVLKNVPKGAVKSKAVPVANLRKLLKAAFAVRPNLARMMLLQFYGVMRPSELPKVVYQQGEEQEKGVFAIVGKTTRKTGEMRPILLTDEALKLLKQIEPLYKNGLGYSTACFKLGRKLRELHGDNFIEELTGTPDLRPHFLRHTANQALIDAGVREEHIRTAMGRLKARVDRGYGKNENYRAARKGIQALAKLVAEPK